MVQKITSNPDFADNAGKFNQKRIMRLVHRFFLLADLLASSFAAFQFEEEKCKRKKPANHKVYRFFSLELLGRFELPTSSLPMTCSAY